MAARRCLPPTRGPVGLYHLNPSISSSLLYENGQKIFELLPIDPHLPFYHGGGSSRRPPLYVCAPRSPCPPLGNPGSAHVSYLLYIPREINTIFSRSPEVMYVVCRLCRRIHKSTSKQNYIDPAVSWYFLCSHGSSTPTTKSVRVIICRRRLRRQSGRDHETLCRPQSGPSRATAGPGESILAGPCRNLIPTETSCQLSTGKTSRSKLPLDGPVFRHSSAGGQGTGAGHPSHSQKADRSYRTSHLYCCSGIHF